MISPEVLKQIREIEIRTRRAMNGGQMGGYRTAQKGSGFEFDQIRDYQYGDDIRSIDWKSSARAQKILVKQYLEERNRTIMIGVDISRSMLFSSTHLLKIDVVRQIAAAITLIANYGRDQVGLLLFSNKIEAVIEPGRGPAHVQRLLQELFLERQIEAKTDINVFFNHPLIKNKKREFVFLLSDFIVDDFEKKLISIAQHKECLFIRCVDDREKEFLPAGLLWMEDLETGELALIDTRNKKSKKISEFMENLIKNQQKISKKYKIKELLVKPDDDFIKEVAHFFKNRLI